MAIDKAVDSAVLDADLTSVADAIRAKGGITGEIAFPSGMVTAINNISTGATVKTASGSAKTSSRGLITLNIGFKPDLIVLKVGTVNGYEYNLNLSLTEKWTSSKAGCTSWYGENYVYEAYVNNVGNTSTSLYIYGYDSSWKSGAASGVTFDWKAVKYTV